MAGRDWPGWGYAASIETLDSDTTASGEIDGIGLMAGYDNRPVQSRSIDKTLPALERQHRLEMQMEQETYKELLRDMAEKYERRVADLESKLRARGLGMSSQGPSGAGGEARLQAVLEQQEHEIDELLARLQESEREVLALRERVKHGSGPSLLGDLNGESAIVRMQRELLERDEEITDLRSKLAELDCGIAVPRHVSPPRGRQWYGDHPHTMQASALKAALEALPCHHCTHSDVHLRQGLEDIAWVRHILQHDLGWPGAIPPTLGQMLQLVSERCVDVMATLGTLRDFTTAVGEMVWSCDDGTLSDIGPSTGAPVLSVELRSLQHRLQHLLQGGGRPRVPARRSATSPPRTSGDAAMGAVARGRTPTRRGRSTERILDDRRQEMLQFAGRQNRRSVSKGWDNGGDPRPPFRN